MNRKIIFVSATGYSKRDYHRFGAEYLEDHGYEVELWWVYNGRYVMEKVECSAGLYEGDNQKKLYPKEFENEIQKNRNAIYILMSFRNKIYMRAMAKYKCTYFVIAGIGKIITEYKSVIAGHSVIRWLKKYHGKFKGMVSEIKNGYLYFRYHMPKYVFLGVPIEDKWLQHVPADRINYIHSYDYDRYLEVKKDNEIGEEYIVCVDSGFGNVDEDSFLGAYKDPWCEEGEVIWEKLGAIFDKLEEHYQLPLVVAGHPHTIYKNDKLCGREVIYNRTHELVANAKFVIMQWSTAISFAVLFKKEILILVDDPLTKFFMWDTLFAPGIKYFNLLPCNMDNEEMANAPWKYVQKIDDKLAQAYIEEYIKMPGAPEKYFIEVIEEKIQELSAT